MPLYECSNCHAVENTALTNFWGDHIGQEKPALCSECDPAIGKWHGKFEKINIADYRVRFPDSAVRFTVPPTAQTPPDRERKR